MSKFKFIFCDGEHLYKNAESIQEAAILASATRILGKKPPRIMTCFAESVNPKTPNKLEPVAVPSVTILLK